MIAGYRDHLTGDYPISLAEIGSRANALFGDEPPAEVLEAAAVVSVEAVDQPTFDAATQYPVEGAPVRKGGKWLQTWKIVDRPAVPAAIATEIADWQFATILAEDRIITQGEAEDFAGAGTIPAALEAAIDKIEDDALRRRTRIKVRGAKTYIRTDPSTIMLAGLLGYQGEAVDDIWRRGALIG